MNSAPLEQLKEIFHAARELPSSERGVFLSSACGNDEQLRKEIDALLESDRAADDFIASPPSGLVADAFGSAPDSSPAGRMIGHYRLRECIGSGGMGAVYLAERADQQFQMQVAIKLIKRGMDTDSVLRRFQHERQILASLEHPHIARLLDGGTTEDEVPYFVMEYIEGDRIDRYAEAHQLSISERLELFLQVCGAVSYAHQRLVVHRDLKPSNVLVTSAGVPKLLDFGIAKIIQPNDSAELLATITMVPLMTPEYASPEQIEGAPATTLSDVYSLGALLYELLTGRPPYRLQNRTPQEIEKAISTGQIEKPSAVASRPEDARRLRGDLDNIVRMAMRKETARRYRSVEQFSEDIRRHLAERPIIARPDTFSYRSAKFFQRNRLAVTAAALLLLTLVGGIIATTWQAHKARLHEKHARAEQARAERRFNDVRKLANNVLFDYHDAIKDLPGATKVRERLVQDGLNYLDGLAGEAQSDPALQRELAAAYERVGDVRGGESSGSLGDITGALESYAKALGIREALVAASSSDAQARRDLARSHQKIGWRLQATREKDPGIDHLQKAATLYHDLTLEDPGNDEIQAELSSARNQLGQELSSRNDFAGALAQHQAALAVSEKLVAKHPQDQRYRYGLLASQDYISFAFWLQDDYPAAREANSRALALGEALLAEYPLNADYRRILVLIYQHGGNYRKMTDKRGALEYFEKAAALDEELLAADPANAITRKDLAYAHKKMADLSGDLEDWPGALLHYQTGSASYERIVADAPNDLIAQFFVATCHGGVAQMQAKLGQVGAALEECRKAVAVLQKFTGDDPSLGKAQGYEYLGHAYTALAETPNVSVSDRQHRLNTARDMFRQSLRVLDDLRSSTGGLGVNEVYAKAMSGQIAKCDAALAQ